MRTMGIKVTILIMLLLTTQGCAKSENGTKPNDVPEKLAFTLDPPGEPVVSSGSAGWPIFPSDPMVLKDDEGYHLFYTTLFCGQGSDYYYSWDSHDIANCDITKSVGTIGYAFSADQGRTWEFRGTPVLLPGPDEWQIGDLETAYAVVHDGTLYLFYCALGAFNGQPFTNRYEIGVATLALGGSSLKEALLDQGARPTKRSQPLLPYNTGAVAFDNNTQEPSVVAKDSLFELFYVGVSFALPDQPDDAPGQELVGVGLAKATFDWNLNLISNSSDFILTDVNIPEVEYAGDTYHLFATTMSIGEFHQSEKIVYYSSSDGETWTGPENLLAPGAGGDFDNWGIMAPTVVIEPESIVMFYSGWSIEDHQCFPDPFPPTVRFGRPSFEDTKCIYGAFGRAVSVKPKLFR